MFKLEIAIPTYNHSDMIRFLINKYEENLALYDFCISIHDSSTDNDTEKIVKSSKFYNEKIYYYRHSSEIDLDTKTIMCFEYAQAEFVYLTGDGWLVNVPELFNRSLFEKNYEIIHIYDVKNDHYKKYFNDFIKHDKLYIDSTEYIKDNFWHLILYGSVLINRDTYAKYNHIKLKKLFPEIGFIFPCSVAYYKPSNVFVTCFDILIHNPYKKESGWVTNKTAIQAWTKCLYADTIELIDVYDKAIIKRIIKECGNKYKTTFTTLKAFAWYKRIGAFNLSIYKEYNYYIKQTKNCSTLGIFIVLLVPKFVFDFLHKIIKRGKRK